MRACARACSAPPRCPPRSSWSGARPGWRRAADRWASRPVSSGPMDVSEALRRGLVIPAHPLALDADRRLDERRQAALTRYYCAAGAGGVAVGVHTTQFAIRHPKVALLRPVLALAMAVLREHAAAGGTPLVAVAGVCGPTPQAVAEAELARGLGYDAGLLSLAALREASNPELLAHCRRVAEVLPLFGFYLQP